MQSLGARFADESVLELDAGEGASGHHSIVASAGTIRVKLPRCQAEGNMDQRLVSWPNLVFSAPTSNTDRLLSRYLAAALTLAMLPAGEM